MVAPAHTHVSTHKETPRGQQLVKVGGDDDYSNGSCYTTNTMRCTSKPTNSLRAPKKGKMFFLIKGSIGTIIFYSFGVLKQIVETHMVA